MPQQGSPLLDQYNQDGIVTPALQRALDRVKQTLPTFQGLQPTAPETATRTLQPPGAGVPPITRTPAAPAPGLVSPGGQAPSQPAPTPGVPATPPTPMITDPNAAAHLANRNRLIESGPGSNQIKNPVARGLIKGLSAVGDSIFPQITMNIPGTGMHHELLVHQANRTVEQDTARAKDKAATAEDQKRTAALPTEEEAQAARAAETRERNAQAQNLEHPRPKDLTDVFLRDHPNAKAEDLAAFMQKDYETRENARATAEAAHRQPSTYADFRAGYVKKNPNATGDEIAAAYSKSQKSATETSAEDDQKYEALVAKQKLGQALTPEEKASMAAYRDRKTLGQQTTNVFANERADRAGLSKEAAELHKQLIGEFSTVRTQLDNVAQAREDINTNPVGQNLGTIKTIVALAGGKGSGVRITQSELNSLASNLGLKTTFQNWLSSVEGQGRFSPETMRQINQVLDAVEKIAKEKEAKLNGALDSLQGAKSKEDIDRIDRDYRHGSSQGSTENAPKVGDTKTFPNGKTGKWDGKGWVQQ